MNVLLLNENRGFGGAEVHTLDLARVLAERGHRVRLGVRRRSWLRERAEAQDLQVDVLAMANEVDLVTMAALAVKVRRHRIEVVHCHATRDMVLASQARRAFPAGTAVVKTEHTFLDGSVSGLCRQAYASGMDRVMCVSEALRRQLLERLGLPGERFPVVPNGIDTARAAPGHGILPLLREGRWVGVVGSLLPIKGQRDFLEAARILRDSHPQLRFLIAGEGPEREALVAAAGDLPVSFAGFLADPLQALAGLEVVAVPSTVETFSLVSLEAMALGRPVVASRVGGVPEVVLDGVTGTLVPPSSPAALAAAIARYLDDPDLAARHGEEARRRAVEEFSRERMAERVERVYEEARS